jgi:thiol-disulfide isomerase/thioredoxin
MRIGSIIILLLALGLTAQAQTPTGYKLEFAIKGLKDTTVLLGYYIGEATYVRDTARADRQGNFFFDGKERLPEGGYFLAINKIKSLEFVIGKDQHFHMQTSVNDFVLNMKVTGDEDNELYFTNMQYLNEEHKMADPLLKVIQDSTLTEDKKKDAREAFKVINDRVMAHQDKLINEHPATMFARLMKVSRPINIPEPPKKPDGSIDSTFQLRYYRKHFFDNLDLADDAMTRLPRPYYAEKLNEYLDKLFVQTPDSLMPVINELASRAKVNKETYKFLVWNCVYKYSKPAIMGLDEIYVRLADQYILSGEMDYWMDASLKKNVKEYADKLRNSLIGKTGANLRMQDVNFQPRSMYDIKRKYTILYIFDPDCGHCREETPKLVSLYNKSAQRLSFEVFAVSADTSMQKLRDYIKEMKMPWITVNGPRSYVGAYTTFYFADQTPSLYIVDAQHKIIAKGIPADKLEDFFVNYERYLQRKAAQKAKPSGQPSPH